MARAGNHGIVIPRDPVLLREMYWGRQMSLPEMAEAFGVTHCSVRRAMESLGIPRRAMNSKRQHGCRICGKPPVKIRHSNNGAMYGRLCGEHRKAHYNKLSREAAKRPHIAAKRKEYMARWYHAGAINPKGEEQWLTKSKALLRTVQRLTQTGRLAVSQSLSEASVLALILPDLSPL